MNDERLAQIRALCANWRASGYIDRSLARFVLGDVEWLLHALADAETRTAQLTRAMAEMGALAHDLAGMEHGARCEQMRAMHQLGIIATEESLAAHLARADAFTARQYERIDAARPDAGDTKPKN